MRRFFKSVVCVGVTAGAMVTGQVGRAAPPAEDVPRWRSVEAASMNDLAWRANQNGNVNTAADLFFHSEDLEAAAALEDLATRLAHEGHYYGAARVIEKSLEMKRDPAIPRSTYDARGFARIATALEGFSMRLARGGDTEAAAHLNTIAGLYKPGRPAIPAPRRDLVGGTVQDVPR